MEDGGKFRCCGVEVEGLEVVEQVKVEAGVGRVLDEDYVGFGQFAADAFAVHVATDGGDGSDFAEVIEDGGFADVAEVEDAVDAMEGGSDFRAEETVGIGDDSELHVFRISCAGGGRLREGARKSR